MLIPTAMYSSQVPDRPIVCAVELLYKLIDPEGSADMPEQDRHPVYEFGGWEVDLARGELRAGGVPVPLGSRAFQDLCGFWFSRPVNSSPRTSSWPVYGRARSSRKISSRFTYPLFARRSGPIEER